MPTAPGSNVNKIGGIPFFGSALPVPAMLGCPPVVGGFTTGNTWFVSSTHANRSDNTSSGHSPVEPFATIEYAYSQCTANNGDIIYVLPLHVETVAATDLNLDVAGVQVIGIGCGASRPPINLTATGSPIANSVASTLLYNLLITGGIDNITTVFTDTGPDLSVINCGYRDVTGQCAIFYSGSAAADRTLFNGFTYEGDLAAGTTRAFQINGSEKFTLCNFLAEGNFSTSFGDCVTVACTQIQVYNGRFRTANAADLFWVDTITASTGAFGPNLYGRVQDNAANITEFITGATFVVYDDVYVVNLANEKGVLINWVASTDT